MSYHIRVRPTALIVKDECILLVEYRDDRGFHYNLPGGGAEPGETILEGVSREVYEETTAHVDAGPLAFAYECAPHKQSGDYPDAPHTLYLIFECFLKENSEPIQPGNTDDPKQTAVKWLPVEQLDSIVLFPNISRHIKDYIVNRKSIELIEDYKLAMQYR